RNCQDKKRSQALIQTLNQVEPVDISDLESLYSLADEPSDSVLCTIAYSELSSDDDSDTDSLEDAKVLSKFDLKYGFWQLAMITIFEPILANTLVYIDDILLFSPDEQSHAKLLSKFYSLVTKYGIMLSEKKMEVGVTTIQFLGMEISDGRYHPQPHVAQELLKFLDELSSQKMIQQFLGLV
nr:hypothetical protein [Tanacetum cinerariifolium]